MAEHYSHVRGDAMLVDSNRRAIAVRKYTAPMIVEPTVFVSYSRTDVQFARSVSERLQALGFNLWRDLSHLEAGRDWWEQIQDAIEGATALVLCLSKEAIDSGFVEKEWRYAGQVGTRVVPIIAVTFDFLLAPRWIKKLDWIDFRGGSADADLAWSRFVAQLNDPSPVPRVPFMAPDPPPQFVPRPEERQSVVTLLTDDVGSPPTVVALHGGGGFGKTSLAAAIARDDLVNQRFPDGVLWVTLGEHAKQAEVNRELNSIYGAVTGDRSGFASVHDASQALAQRLADRELLIVIDDVWRVDQLKPFLQGAPSCPRLLTTRQFEVASWPATARVPVGEMTTAQSVALLMSGVASERVTPRLRELTECFGGFPLLLGLANGALRKRLARGQSLAKALEYLETAYTVKGPTAFDLSNAEERDSALARSLRASLDELNSEQAARFSELAVFAEDASVPLSEVAILWSMAPFHAGELAQHLADLSLLKLDLNREVISLHDVIRAMLLKRVGDAIVPIHQRLVTSWGDLSQLDGEFRCRWVGYHLTGAQCGGDLSKLLKNASWLHRRVSHASVQDVIADFERLKDDRAVSIIHRAFLLSAHVVARHPRLLGSQLQGRLVGVAHADASGVLESIDSSMMKGGLWPLKRSLTSPAGPLLRTLTGHKGFTESLSITPDGRLALSGHDTGRRRPHLLTMWNVEDGLPLWSIEGNDEPVTEVLLSPDGNQALTAVGGTFYTSPPRIGQPSLQIWDLLSRQVRVIEMESKCVALAASREWRIAAASGEDGTLTLLDLDRGVAVAQLKHPQWRPLGDPDVPFNVVPRFQAMAFMTDDRLLAASEGSLYLCDFDAQEARLFLRGASGAIRALAVAAEANVIVIGAGGKSRQHPFDISTGSVVEVWDLGAQQPRCTLNGHTDLITSIDVSANGSKAVTSSEDGSVRVWDLVRGSEANVLLGHSSEVTAVRITSDGKTAISAAGSNVAGQSHENAIKVWDLTIADRDTPDHRGVVSALTVIPGTDQAISAGDDGFLQRWDLSCGRSTARVAAHDAAIRVIQITPDGRKVISGSADRTFKIWDLETFRLERTCGGHSDDVSDIALSADGRRLLTAALQGEEPDPVVRLWNMESGECALQIPQKGADSIAISPDGRWGVWNLGRGRPAVWDLTTGKMRRTLSWRARWGSHNRNWMFVPDGTKLIGHLTDAEVWDTDTWAEPVTLSNNASVGSFSSKLRATTQDSRHIVLANCDELRLWDLETHTMLWAAQHEADVECVAIAAVARTIVSAGSDGAIRIWSLDDGVELGVFLGDYPMRCCAITSDGSHVVAGDHHGFVHILKVQDTARKAR